MREWFVFLRNCCLVLLLLPVLYQMQLLQLRKQFQHQQRPLHAFVPTTVNVSLETVVFDYFMFSDFILFFLFFFFLFVYVVGVFWSKLVKDCFCCLSVFNICTWWMIAIKVEGIIVLIIVVLSWTKLFCLFVKLCIICVRVWVFDRDLICVWVCVCWELNDMHAYMYVGDNFWLMAIFY